MAQRSSSHLLVRQWHCLRQGSGRSARVVCIRRQGALKLPPAAVLYTGASLVVPSLASIFNEWALKRHMDTSVHLQNFYLYVFGLGFNTTGLLLVAALTGRSLPTLFSGHSKVSPEWQLCTPGCSRAIACGSDTRRPGNFLWDRKVAMDVCLRNTERKPNVHCLVVMEHCKRGAHFQVET